MFYKFNAYGHPNIVGTHKTTFEFTKDEEVSLKGDCIVGVKADFDLRKLKEFILNSKDKKITIRIETSGKEKNKEIIKADLNPNFNHNREFVMRKTDFISDRTFAIKSNKSSFELNRALIRFLQEKKNKITVTIKNKMPKKTVCA